MKNNELDNIVKKALANYNGPFPTIKFHIKATSTIYKVTNASTQEFALKIYDDHSSNLMDNQIEILLLDAIQKKGSFRVPELQKNKAGQFITEYLHPKTDITYRLVLFKWLAGNHFKDQETPALFFKLGQLVAELHLITKDIKIPENVVPKKWNQVFYFRNEKAVYQEEKYHKIVSSEYKELMQIAIPLLNQKLKNLYNSAPTQLLHGDLNPGNIKIHQGQLSILDFEDAILGHPVHDLAILLFYYQDHKKLDYDFVKYNIIAGYKSIYKLPIFNDNTIEMLFIARQVNFLNYVLTLDGDFKTYIEKGLNKLRKFLKSV